MINSDIAEYMRNIKLRVFKYNLYKNDIDIL